MNSKLRQTVIILFYTAMMVLVSCQGNRLKTDEKKLAEEILLKDRESEEAARIASEQQLSDTLKKLPPGFRFKEDRSVDRSRPPVVIDVAGSLNNIKGFALSDVASKITYIRMQKVPDTGFSRVMKFKYYLTDKNIIAVNPCGILLYNRDGKYICTIVRNEFTGIEVEANRMIVNSDNTFIGGSTSVWAAGSSLFYKYRNSLTGQSYIMEYDCSQPQVNLSSRFDPEKPLQIRGQGKVSFDLNFGKKPTPMKGSSNGMWSAGSDYMYQSLSSMMLDRNTYAKQLSNPVGLGGDYTLAIFNQRGDTLATFTQFEQVTEFSKSVMRGTDYGNQYENNGKYYIRNAFNDTVFQVVPPNRLLPLYVLKLGTWKLSKNEGLNPDFDLKGRIIPQEWADTKNYIFISFSKDSYSCPYTREKKQLKQYYALYSKQNRCLYIVKGNPFDYEVEILRNNLDGGLPVWPSSYMIGNRGEILVSVKGYELKERVKSDAFNRSTAPAAKKNELKKLAQSVTDSEDILMIVE
jgi:hypothetical protein